jgi:GNAT superfamily N-acetyltransferase
MSRCIPVSTISLQRVVTSDILTVIRVQLTQRHKYLHKMGSSTNSQLVLEPATLDDIPAITQLWFDAFTLPMVQQLWPNTPKMHEWTATWHGNNIQKPNFRYLRVVDPEVKDEQGKPRIVSFAAWDMAMPEERGVRFPPWCEDSPKETCDALIAGLERERKRVMGDQKHYCTGHPLPLPPDNITLKTWLLTKRLWGETSTDLDTVGTHPDYQKRGAGSMLMKWGCDLADKDGVPLYVDASKEGAFLYKKYGFVDYSPAASEVASMARGLKTA